MTDILDAAQSINPATDTNPPVPPPPPTEPPPEPPPAPSPSDDLVVPQPEEVKTSEPSKENVQSQPNSPKKKRIKPAVLIATLLLLLLTLPLTVFFVSQQNQLADIRSQAKGKKIERYGLNTDKYRNNLERALLRDGITVNGKSYGCSGGAGGTKCDIGGKTLTYTEILNEAVKQETEKAGGGTTAPTSGTTPGVLTVGNLTTYSGTSACALMSDEALIACQKLPPKTLSIKEVKNTDGTTTKYFYFEMEGGAKLTSSQTFASDGKTILSSTDNVGTTWNFDPNIGKPCTKDAISDSCGSGLSCSGTTVIGVQKGPGGVISGTCVADINPNFGKPCTKTATSDSCGSGLSCSGTVIGVQKGPGGVISGTCVSTHGVAGTPVPFDITIPSGTGKPFCAAGHGCPDGWGCTGDVVPGTQGSSFASRYCEEIAVTIGKIDIPTVEGGGGGGATPTSPPPQCISLVVYKGGSALNSTDLAALHVGDVITLALAPGGSATKVRFRVNSTSDADWHETTTKNANSQFVWDYTLANATSFNVTAQWFDGTSWH